MKTINKFILYTLIGICIISLAFVSLLVYYELAMPDERLLVNAAANDDLEKFKEIAAKGVNLDAQEQGMQGHTPLIATTFIQGTNVFFYLLSSGAKVDARDRDGDTALMTAVMLGDANLVKIKALIEAGADVNASNHGASVLRNAQFAGQGGHIVTNTIALLKQNGAKE